MVVLKELIFNSFYFGEGCGGPERTNFLTVSTFGGFGGHEESDCSQFLLWVRVWWSSKN